MAISGYTVQHGDTLWSIARAHGMSLAQLEAANPQLANNFNMIQPGQGIHFPGHSAPVPSGVHGQPPPSAHPPARTSAGGSGTTVYGRKPPVPPTVHEVQAPDPYTRLLNQLQGLPGQERDAYAALTTLFNSYGLSSLAPKILNFLQNGFGSDTITTLLQQTPEYKARFSGNEARIKNGLQVLTPAEYLSTEASYRQLLRVGGLDPSFMTQDQYSKWIGDDVSPTELQGRVNLATQAVTSAPPELTSAFAQLGIAHGDLASYFLNDKNPTPALQLKMNQAQIIQAAKQSGLNTDNASALQYAQQGVTYDQANQGYQKISQILPEANKLSAIYGHQAAYGQQQAEKEFLGNSGSAENARIALTQQEESNFSGQGGTGQKSFVQQTAGTGF